MMFTMLSGDSTRVDSSRAKLIANVQTLLADCISYEGTPAWDEHEPGIMTVSQEDDEFFVDIEVAPCVGVKIVYDVYKIINRFNLHGSSVAALIRCEVIGPSPEVNDSRIELEFDYHQGLTFRLFLFLYPDLSPPDLSTQGLLNQAE